MNNFREDTLTDIMINDRDTLDSGTSYEKNSYVNPAANQSPSESNRQINITSNIASNTARPATLPISSPFGPPSDSNLNLSTMVKSSTTGDLNSTGLVASLAPTKGTPIDTIKEWSLTTYKCTRQLVNERLGKSQRTVDSALEGEIERLKDTQRSSRSDSNNSRLKEKKVAKEMMSIYSNLITQQQLLYENLNELAMKESKSVDQQQPITNGNSSSTSSASNDTLNLTSDFKQNASMLKNLSKNGEKLILALKFFCSNLHTLVNKTIEDTMITIRNYEAARLEYDAERNSVANLLPAQAVVTANTEKMIATKAKYEKLREDVSIKLKFLDENKTKVMHKQLILFYNAFSSFAAGNASSLENTLKQFSIKPSPPSFLEK